MTVSAKVVSVSKRTYPIKISTSQENVKGNLKNCLYCPISHSGKGGLELGTKGQVRVLFLLYSWFQIPLQALETWQAGLPAEGASIIQKLLAEVNATKGNKCPSSGPQLHFHKANYVTKQWGTSSTLGSSKNWARNGSVPSLGQPVHHCPQIMGRHEP